MNSGLQWPGRVLKDRVTFLGRKSHQEVARWMCAGTCPFLQRGGNGRQHGVGSDERGMTVITTPVVGERLRAGRSERCHRASGRHRCAGRSYRSLLRDPASMRSLGIVPGARSKSWTHLGSCADSYLALYREVLSGGQMKRSRLYTSEVRRFVLAATERIEGSTLCLRSTSGRNAVVRPGGRSSAIAGRRSSDCSNTCTHTCPIP